MSSFLFSFPFENTIFQVRISEKEEESRKARQTREKRDKMAKLSTYPTAAQKTHHCVSIWQTLQQRRRYQCDSEQNHRKISVC